MAIPMTAGDPEPAEVPELEPFSDDEIDDLFAGLQDKDDDAA